MITNNSSKELKTSPNRINLYSIYRKYGIFIVLVFMCIISSFLSPIFLTKQNIINVIRQISITTIIACGETLLIIAGLIDLGPGSVVALAGCISVDIALKSGSLGLGVLAGIVVGGITGLINGAVITKYKLPPFIVTLAMMTAARGGALLYTNGLPIINIGEYAAIGQGSIGIIPIPVIILAVTVIITWIILNYTKFGVYLYAIGGNEEAAIASGIRVKKMKVIVYLIAGLFTGVAGIVLMARLNSGLPNAGQAYEFDAITAVIIGGTSFNGGIGGVSGTLIGALIIGVLNNMLNLMNVQSYVQQILKGIIIVLAVILDMKTKSIRTESK